MPSRRLGRSQLQLALTEQTSLSPAAALWWGPQPSEHARPTRSKLFIRQMGDEPGPELKAPTTVTIKQDSRTALTTVRVSAPAAYRALSLDKNVEDSPDRVVAELCRLAGCKATALTGGRWQRVSFKSGSTLVGYIRVPDSLYLKLRALSGNRGVFCSPAGKDRESTQVAWLPKEAGFSTEDYHMYALAQAQHSKLPLAYRQGGGANLGLIGAEPLDFSPPKATVWWVYDTPRSWLQEDLEDFLSEQQWRQTKVLSRRRLGSRKKASSSHVWVVKALPRETLTLDPPYTYADDTSCITITPEEGPRRQVPKTSEPLRAPRRKGGAPSGVWAAEDDVAPTQLDAEVIDDDEEDEGSLHKARSFGAEPKAKASDDKQRSRPHPYTKERPKQDRKVAVGTSLAQEEVDPDRLLLNQNPSWTLHDNQGAGDCGFRSFAQGLAFASGKQLSEAQLACEASKLRLLAVAHLNKHVDTFAPQWAQDPEEKPEHRGFQPEATTFKEYTQLATRRDFWLDGMLLAALCERVGTPCVVWSLKAGTSSWQRSVIAPWIENGQAQAARKAVKGVALVLRDGHYRTFKPPDSESVPTQWLLETELRERGMLRGGGKAPYSIASKTPSRTGAASSRRASVFPSKVLPRHDGHPLFVPKGQLRCPKGPRGPPEAASSCGSSCKGSGLLSLASETPPRAAFGGSSGPSRAASQGQKRKAALWLPSSTPRKASRAQAALSLCSATPGPSKRSRTAAPSKDRLSEALSSAGPTKAPDLNRSELRSCRFQASKGSSSSQKEVSKAARPGAASASSTRAPRGHGKRSRESAAEGRELWWTCDCGFKVFRHGALKNHCYHRKRHLHLAHGIPWDEIGPGPKSPPKQAFPGSTLHAATKWKILRRLFLRNAWPGAHRIAEKMHESSSYGAPMHQCSKCKKMLRRTQLCTSLCEKHPSPVGAPSLSKRKKFWNAWVAQAAAEASRQRVAAKELRAQESRKDLASSTAACKKQSGAKTLAARPGQGVLGLPVFEASSPAQRPRAWWTCPVPGCGFSLEASDPGKSGKRKMHLTQNHGKESYQPLAKGDLQTLVNRIPSARKTFDERWEYVFAQWSQSGWKGTHCIGKDPCAYRQYHNSKGLPYVKSLFWCSVCNNTVEKSQIPREVCPAAKCRASPSPKLRAKQWKLWGKQARTTIGKNVAKKLARKSKQSTSQSAAAGS